MASPPWNWKKGDQRASPPWNWKKGDQRASPPWNWNCWNASQRGFSTLIWTAEMSIKGLLYFDLELVKCRSKVFSTSTWSWRNFDQRFSLLRSRVVEISIKGLLYFDLELFLYFDLKLLKCRSKVFSTSIWSWWNFNQRSSLLQFEIAGVLIKGLLYFNLELLPAKVKIWN